MFQVRHPAGSKDTVIIPKILGISEEVSTETVEYAGEFHEKKTVTVILYLGHDFGSMLNNFSKVLKND